jgi:hypothetical protein
VQEQPSGYGVTEVGWALVLHATCVQEAVARFKQQLAAAAAAAAAVVAGTIFNSAIP